MKCLLTGLLIVAGAWMAPLLAQSDTLPPQLVGPCHYGCDCGSTDSDVHFAHH